MQKGRLVINKAFHILKLVFVMLKSKVYLQPQILKNHKSYVTFRVVFMVENDTIIPPMGMKYHSITTVYFKKLAHLNISMSPGPDSKLFAH